MRFALTLYKKLFLIFYYYSRDIFTTLNSYVRRVHCYSDRLIINSEQPFKNHNKCLLWQIYNYYPKARYKDLKRRRKVIIYYADCCSLFLKICRRIIKTYKTVDNFFTKYLFNISEWETVFEKLFLFSKLSFNCSIYFHVTMKILLSLRI